MERNPEELTPMERREQVIGELVLAYSAVLQDGRYDIAFNRLSKYLYDLRSLQFELERDLGDES
jgi:hypothetical protein